MIRKIIKWILTNMNTINKPSTALEQIEKLRKNGLKIGDNVNINHSHVDFEHAFLISIGNNVTITNASLLAHDASTKKELGYTKCGRIDIGDNVFIGFGSIILPNTKVGNNVIIGAGAVVAHDIPDNSVVCGNPCKTVCTYDEYMEKYRKIMATSPFYEKPLCEYSEEKKKKAKEDLEGKIGFEL